MAKKYYVIWKGIKTGVFDNWPEVQQLTSGRADAQYMGFSTKQDAEKAFKESYTKALTKRSLTQKKPSAKPENTSNTSAHGVNADIQIYSDGACSPNPGQAGTGIAVYQKNKLAQLWYGLYDANGTNNTAELLGLLESFKLAQQYLRKNSGMRIEVLSDSRYSIDCITKWAPGWQRKGWKKADGQPIKNPEIIKACFELYQQIKQQVIVSHVKGHANIEGNELADRMAVYARMTKQKSFVTYENALNITSILAMPSG
ncbi:ribonuclease H family protein [Thalassotalea sp. 1_MG-2023]|uniref:ribonuclease H family protein n=1 Tax=Thalassotalea sp. 1_MG-2023 TaxID=3062680 RepID=UPI0026E19D78|nr:ribonuclease H family protein [Thalassotalea sp. 1_MG-2023]MDO6427884.1 ribonuclease H family protein [Thalassotalea sp. 1_MG-2023]